MRTPESVEIGDPRLSAYRDLTDVQMRSAREPREGIFMAEGLLVIERCVTAGLSIKSVLTAPKWIERLSRILPEFSGPVYVAPEELLRELTGYRVHRGALACVGRPPSRHVADVAALDGDLLVLGDLVDHTNVGLSMRSAAALGIVGAVLSPACADPLYRRAVKSSMGASLTLPWARADAWPEVLTDLGDRAVIALTPDASAPDLRVAVAAADIGGGADTRSVALVVGSEGPGLDPRHQRMCDARARIPMQGDVDSLNVAAAVAVACYALRMRRQQ